MLGFRGALSRVLRGCAGRAWCRPRLTSMDGIQDDANAHWTAWLARSPADEIGGEVCSQEDFVGRKGEDTGVTRHYYL